MNEQYKQEDQQKYSGLTTAALADAGERAPSRNDFELRPPETELQPKAGVASAPLSGVSNVTIGEAAAIDETATPLFAAGEAKEFRARWDTIQAGFVDEPRTAVEQADSLVAGAMKRMAEVFADERTKLEAQWDREQSVSTEDLRLALRRYRSFFGRVLSV